MKKVKLAVGILIVVTLLVFASHLYLKHTTTSMAETLNQAESLYTQGKTEDAEKAVIRFNNTWEKNSVLMATFIRHAEMDTVNLSTAKLKPLLQNDEKGDFYAECESLKTQLKHIWKTERFTVDNIL